jgi:monovalent cation/hydrogen antiporter
VLGNGQPLPGRDLAIFIASGVILVSLLVAVIGLPLLLNGARRRADPHAAEERAARIQAAQAAIRAIDEFQETATVDLDEASSALAADVTARVMDIYRRRLATQDEDMGPADIARRTEAFEFQMKLAAMRAERVTLLDMRGKQLINDDTMNKLMREVDLTETALLTRGKGKP